ncbi:hypothetical protein PV10_03693 [Exophiala mesophila]|uniref:Uncharacterized protein n=1 Tax=Exophiala mesophila TaxID=212818 RepID=A0A0D1XVX6_EXOME|nr:uncharacterized protein PV10_03693 [Exophiala mesophila]KIV92391.1 hypothetical protein PV10_03693 [Exophiala mesophila]
MKFSTTFALLSMATSIFARPTTWDPNQAPAEIAPPFAPLMATPGPFVSDITKEHRDAEVSKVPEHLERRGDFLDIALGIAMLIEDLLPGISFPDFSDDPK